MIRISLFLRWAICFPQNGMEIHSKNVFKAKCQVSARVGWRWEFTEFKKSPCWEHLPKKGPLTKIESATQEQNKARSGEKKQIKTNLSHSYFAINWQSQVDYSTLNKKNPPLLPYFLHLSFMVSVGNGRLLEWKRSREATLSTCLPVLQPASWPFMLPGSPEQNASDRDSQCGRRL